MCKIEKKDLEFKITASERHAESMIHDEFLPSVEVGYYRGKLAAYKEVKDYLTLKSSYNHKQH